jgi:predicted Zn-dependent protease
MTVIGRRELLGGLCCCSSLVLAGCAASVPSGRLEPGYKPQLATDEGGLWQTMEKAESEIKHSHNLVRDPDLNAYVREIVCRLGEAHCTDLRVYIVRTPFFNANMAPNGMMQVWTGLLLRTQNEAQLAAILGHEMGHYLERHSLQRWRNTRATSDFAAVLGLGGAYTLPAQLLALGSISAFSRDQERRADEIGLELMTQAGYQPLEASRVWEQLIAEDEKAQDKSPKSVFFASHPGAQERMATLRSKAEAGGTISGETFADRYHRNIASVRRLLLQDELKLRQYDRSLVVLQNIAANQSGGEDAEIAYFVGEVYRLRDEGDDRSRALDAFERATARADCPPEAYRSVGVVRLRDGDHAAADAAFTRYLELKPDASDREMVRSYLQNRG